MNNEYDSISVLDEPAAEETPDEIDFDPDAAAEAAKAKAEQLRSEIANLKTRRTELAARITAKNEELKKVERFISASTPRTRKAKS